MANANTSGVLARWRPRLAVGDTAFSATFTTTSSFARGGRALSSALLISRQVAGQYYLEPCGGPLAPLVRSQDPERRAR
jgi:hypothetical protein